MILLLTVAAAQVADTGRVPSASSAPIIVTGHGLRGSKGDAAYSVTAIDRHRIGESASGRLEDVLREVAGQQSFRRSDARSSNATNQSITLRGMGGNASSRALLILDGVPQSDPFGGWISFPAFSTDRLSAIRVSRGGGSSLWGPGALAGTVELESAGPGELRPLSGSVWYGSRDSLDARAGLMVGNRTEYVSVAGAFSRGDGFIPIVAKNRGPVDRPAPYRQYSLSARAGTSIDSDTEVQANLSAFGDRRERGQANTDNRGKGIDGSLRLVGRGAIGWSLLGYGQKRVFASQSAAVDAARTTSTLANDQYDVPSTGWGGRAELIPVTGQTELRAGADFRLVEGETNELYQYLGGAPTRYRRAGGRSLTAGMFVDGTLTRGRWTANLSGRVDQWSISGGSLFQQQLSGAVLTDTRFAGRHGWEATGRAGLAYRPADKLKLRGAAYRGWRMPTLNELYRPFRVGSDITAANAALKPETSVGGEIGADLRNPAGWSAGVTLFTGHLDNAIANVTVAAGPGAFPEGFVPGGGSYRRRENLRRIHTRGVELTASGRTGSVDLHLSYAFVDARIRADGLAAPLDDLRPAQVPNHFLSASLGWSGPGDLRAALTARGVSRQFEDDLNQRILRAAVTFDGYVRVPLRSGFAIEGRAENIFDRTVEAARSGSDVVERATPRTLWLGLSIR
jgi:outer membrane receptor protein involved in Fe transport